MVHITHMLVMRLFFYSIEMCGNENHIFLNEVLYVYNNELPTNEHNKSIDNAMIYGNYIKNNGNRYSKLSNDIL
jgi:hypothetical protein